MFLPISDALFDAGGPERGLYFQEYVAPSMSLRRACKPYTLTHLPRMAKMIRSKAGLPDDLRCPTYEELARHKWLKLVSLWDKLCRLQDTVIHNQ